MTYWFSPIKNVANVRALDRYLCCHIHDWCPRPVHQRQMTMMMTTIEFEFEASQRSNVLESTEKAVNSLVEQQRTSSLLRYNRYLHWWWTISLVRTADSIELDPPRSVERESEMERPTQAFVLPWRSDHRTNSIWSVTESNRFRWCSVPSVSARNRTKDHSSDIFPRYWRAEWTGSAASSSVSTVFGRDFRRSERDYSVISTNSPSNVDCCIDPSSPSIEVWESSARIWLTSLNYCWPKNLPLSCVDSACRDFGVDDEAMFDAR